MTLNGFMQHKRKVNLKAALRTMRSKWYQGVYDSFVSQLARVLGCSIEEAEAISKDWLELGFLKFNNQGLLTWRNVRGSF